MLVMIAYSQNEDAKVKILLCEVNNFLDVESLKMEKKKKRQRLLLLSFSLPSLRKRERKEEEEGKKKIIKLRERCQFSKCDEPLER